MEEGVGMGQGGRPGGGGAAKRCKITEEGPKQFARRARGEREEISRVAGVWRSALEGSGSLLDVLLIGLKIFGRLLLEQEFGIISLSNVRRGPTHEAAVDVLIPGMHGL